MPLCLVGTFVIVRSSQTFVASSIKLPSTPTSGARQLGTAIAVSPDHVCTVLLCTEARWIIILPARLPRIPVCSGWRYVMCGILHWGGKREDSICVFICLYGNIYTNPNVILCLNIYLVHENKMLFMPNIFRGVIAIASNYLPCHSLLCCCFPACVPSSEYSYWVTTVDQVISSSLGTSPQSLPSHLYNTTPDPGPVI